MTWSLCNKKTCCKRALFFGFLLFIFALSSHYISNVDTYVQTTK